MDRDILRAKLTHVGAASLPRLCARMTQLVIPHLPPELSADERMVASVHCIDDLAGGAIIRNQRPTMARSITGLIDLIDERQDEFADASCLPVTEALTATLNVAMRPTIDGAAGALLAVSTAVEMKAFMASDHTDDRVMVTSTQEHSAFMEQLRHGAVVTGFERILDREVALAARDPASTP